ncbi:hypothetical protein KCP75_14790 [Salmonella enterica subsp. enterica]|nr:hypothetical protein KCP75_14790 [Salmonella enterica subsp. enterica]
MTTQTHTPLNYGRSAQRGCRRVIWYPTGYRRVLMSDEKPIKDAVNIVYQRTAGRLAGKRQFARWKR